MAIAKDAIEDPRDPEPDVPVKARHEEPGLLVRHAGRVILLDPDDRVLLMRYDDGPPNGIHWSTPGGGLDPGEDYATGAARELAEETGWTDIALLGEIFRRSHVMEHADLIVRQVERFYLARTDRPGREISGVDAMHASDGIAAWRWWSAQELDATAERIWPAELADLIRSASAGGGTPSGGTPSGGTPSGGTPSGAAQAAG